MQPLHLQFPSSYIFFFFFTLLTVVAYKLAAAGDQISINCGSSAATSTALSGREWVGDDDVTNPNFSIKGSSSSSSLIKGGTAVGVDPVPYNTARVSHSQFTYTFHRLGSPGQKLIRLHFNPSNSYNDDFFTVEAGPFILLSNFSPSITAHALSLTTIAKEFCLVTTQENQPLAIIFTPSQQRQKHISYAFINGLEIISLPSTLSYCHGGDFEQHSLWYKNHMVMVQGHKREAKRDLFISLCSKYEFFEGYIPLEGFEIFKLRNHDNTLVSPNPSPPPTTTSSDSSTSNNIIVSVLGSRNAIATFFIATLCLVNIIVHMQLQYWESQLTEEDLKPSDRAKRLCRHFSLAEIESATVYFNDAYVIGKGGFGKVYKGLIDNEQQIIAIKRLKSDSNQGKCEFWTEIEILSELRHVNLVSLIGYCNKQPEMIIVYEYMPRGTLADHLYKLPRKNNYNDIVNNYNYNDAFSFLSWKQRLNICIGAGRGLDYLHTGHGIIHRDVKTSNILLDENFVAKVSDFGLAKTESESELQSLKGTFGYFDPDYYRTRKLTTKSDVYSFGVVLLEVLCGRPAVEPLADEDKRSLTMWAQDKINKGEVEQIVDPSLKEKISPDSLKAFVRVAEKCLRNEPKNRPAMAIVVIRLQFSLKQQENAESLEPSSVITSLADCFPSINGNANSSAQNAYDDDVAASAQQDKEISVLPDQIISNALLQSNITKLAVTTSTLDEQMYIGMTNAGKRDGRKRITHKLSRLLPWNAFSSIAKPLKKKEFKLFSISAPMASRNNRSTFSAAGGRKRIIHKLSRLLPWNAFSSIAKPLKKKEFKLFSMSAPMASRNNRSTFPAAGGIIINNDNSPGQMLAPQSLRVFSFSETISAPMASRNNRSKFPAAGGIIINKDNSPGQMLAHPSLRVFSFSELKAATRNFKSDTLLGEGGFGKVYKGWLDDQSSVIAVKRLNSESMQGFQEWQSEVNFLGRLSHPNLVKLLGYCWEDDSELLLIYEFMQKGSLENHLFGRRSDVQPLSWDIRLQILIGAARGLAFLHSFDRKIIYRDFKASNILLDGSYHAKISDFGLAKLGPTASKTHVSTQVMGTYGYAAPEYVATGHLYVKSDVYGFGVVLVEMLTGLRALDQNRPFEQHSLVDWIKPHLSGQKRLKHVMDSRLQGIYSSTSALHIAKLGLRCLEGEPRNRPSMQEIVETLERIDSANETPRERRRR